jgi:Protein of unknown function (DUF3999)
MFDRKFDRRLWFMLLTLTSAAAAASGDDAPFRFSAPIDVQRSAPFIRLPLPASAYARSQQAGLRDLRVIDASGERVPFALLPPRAAQPESTEQQVQARLYALPPRPAAGRAWPTPVEVVVQGGRITVRQSGAPTAGTARTATAPQPVKDMPGWLFDLGDPRERPRDQPPPQSLRLRWSGPAEFSAGYDIETSDDLRQWRAGGSGQVLALVSAAGPLTQREVALPAKTGRFVRLVWADAGAAPALNGAAVIASRQSAVVLDPPTELVLDASLEPPRKDADETSAEVARRSLHFDLGGVLPLVQIDLRLGEPGSGGTRVAPVQVQARNRVDEAWRDVAGHVFYRFERGGTGVTSPPLALHLTSRYLRIVPDPRAAAIDAANVRLVAQAQLASLVFAAQGKVPFSLLAGAAEAPPSALPIGTLVPSLDEERTRFGQATLGAWSESETVARQARSKQRLVAMRPWLLWAVLLAGVAGLAFMVWRLTRQGVADPRAPGQ